MSDEQQFWAVLTHKRDEGLAHLTDLIARSGFEEFQAWFAAHIVGKVVDGDAGRTSDVEYIIATCALIGAADAMIAWKEREE